MNFIIGNKAVVLIHDTIDNEMSKEISAFIYGLEFLDEVTDLEVSINSPGGSVMAGFSLYSAIKASTKKSNTTVEFLSASIATVVMFATDTLTLNTYSNAMVHNPFGSSEKVLKNVKDSIMAVYSDRFGKNVTKLMDNETWFNSEELNKLGSIDKVIYSNNEVLNFSETNNISEIMELSNSLVKNKFDNMLENDENVENVENTEEVENIENTEINEVEATETEETENEIVTEEVINEEEEIVEVTEEVTETEEEVSETEEVTETEEVINEEEIVEVTEELEVENNVNIEDLLNEIKTLKEENEEMKNQLGVISDSKIKEEKLEVLSNSAIETEEYDKWMDLDLDVIKNLTSTIKKDVKTPKITFSNSKELKFSELSNEEKQDLKENSPEIYSRLFFENK